MTIALKYIAQRPAGPIYSGYALPGTVKKWLYLEAMRTACKMDSVIIADHTTRLDNPDVCVTRDKGMGLINLI